LSGHDEGLLRMSVMDLREAFAEASRLKAEWASVRGRSFGLSPKKKQLRDASGLAAADSLDDLRRRLNLSDSLARRLFVRTQQLEAALAAANEQASENQKASKVPESIASHHMAAAESHRQAAEDDRRRIAELTASVKLLESGPLMAKLRTASFESEQAERKYRQLQEDYRRLASSQGGEHSAAVSLRDRVLACEQARIDDATNFTFRVFGAEEALCAGYVERSSLEHEADRLRRMHEEGQVLQTKLLQRLSVLENETMRNHPS
jgi:hypothetical protein